jgi:hypothetical protein
MVWFKFFQVYIKHILIINEWQYFKWCHNWRHMRVCMTSVFLLLYNIFDHFSTSFLNFVGLILNFLPCHYVFEWIVACGIMTFIGCTRYVFKCMLLHIECNRFSWLFTWGSKDKFLCYDISCIIFLLFIQNIDHYLAIFLLVLLCNIF